MISDNGKFISVGPGPGAELEHACRLAQRGHKVIYYCYNKSDAVRRVNELCGAYPIGLKIEVLGHSAR